jgi:hypothetical protein
MCEREGLDGLQVEKLGQGEEVKAVVPPLHLNKLLLDDF